MSVERKQSKLTAPQCSPDVATKMFVIRKATQLKRRARYVSCREEAPRGSEGFYARRPAPRRPERREPSPPLPTGRRAPPGRGEEDRRLLEQVGGVRTMTEESDAVRHAE